MARDRASRPEAKPQRLFVAFDLPDEALDVVERSEAPFRERYPRARWVPRQNRHVTMKFLGSTWPRLVDWVTRAVGEVASGHGPFETRVADLRAFPSERRARVLWAGLDDAGSHVTTIASALDDALAREFRPEKRAFTPHLTIARFDPPVALEEGLSRLVEESRPFVVDRLVLYSSHLRRPAPVYEAVGSFALGDGESVDLEHVFE